MSITPTTGPTFLARSKKAVAGGIAGALTGASTAVGTSLTDGVIDDADLWVILSAALGGFVVGFAGVWVAPANATG